MSTKISTTVEFQPIIDLLTGDAIGYEALGRVSGYEKEGFLAIL